MREWCLQKEELGGATLQLQEPGGSTLGHGGAEGPKYTILEAYLATLGIHRARGLTLSILGTRRPLLSMLEVGGPTSALQGVGDPTLIIKET